MGTQTISNPASIAVVLVEEYKKMPLEEFLKILENIKACGEQFAKSDDSAFSGRLSEADATIYACCCGPFHDALQKLKKLPRDKTAAPALAWTISWWQTINAFRTSREGGSLD